MLRRSTTLPTPHNWPPRELRLSDKLEISQTGANITNSLLRSSVESETVSLSLVVFAMTLIRTPTVAGQTFLHEILHSLEDFTNATKTTKIAHYQIAYKRTSSCIARVLLLTALDTAFLSIFNMTNIRASTPPFPNPEGIVDYASVATLELRNNMANNGYDGQFFLPFLLGVNSELWIIHQFDSHFGTARNLEIRFRIRCSAAPQSIPISKHSPTTSPYALYPVPSSTR